MNDWNDWSEWFKAALIQGMDNETAGLYATRMCRRYWFGER